MKEFLEKFGLTEILGHILPGAIALCALFCWGVNPKYLTELLGLDSTVFAVILLATAYATGLILSMWGLQGAQAATQKPFFNGGSLSEYILFAKPWLRWKWLRLTAGLPPLPDASVDAFSDMGEIVEGICGLGYMPFLLEPTTQFPLFRAVVMDRLKDKAVSLLQEADVQRRKFLFALGVSQALNVLAISVALRYGLAKGAQVTSKGLPAWLPANHIYSVLFVLLAIVAIAATLRIKDNAQLIAPVIPCSILMCLLMGTPETRLIGLSCVCITICVYAGRARLDSILIPLLFACSLFCILVALALRAHWSFNLPDSLIKTQPSDWALGIVFLIAAYLSKKLRYVSVQCWEREIAHTLTVVRLYRHHF